MDRYTIFVDAGYLYAAAASLLGYEKRSEIRIEFGRCQASLVELSQQLTGNNRLLRIYWYDAASDRKPRPHHNAVAIQPNMQLRLGRLVQLQDGSYTQKGVDTLLTRDLIVLSQRQSFSDIVLVAGDEDLRDGVRVAKDNGVRVHLICAKGPRLATSSVLLHNVDTIHWMDESFVAAFSSKRVVPAASSANLSFE